MSTMYIVVGGLHGTSAEDDYEGMYIPKSKYSIVFYGVSTQLNGLCTDTMILTNVWYCSLVLCGSKRLITLQGNGPRRG